jgi:hypothetical protein
MLTFQGIVLENRNSKQIPAHIYGAAPSVRIARKYKFQAIKIAVGDMGWRAPELGPYSYWFTNNTYFPLPWNKTHLKKIAKSKATTFISSTSVCGLDETKNIEDILTYLSEIISRNKIVLYDTSHILGLECTPLGNCCKFIKKFNINSTPQEELSKLINKAEPAYELGHTVLNSLAFAILLNCNPILISGVEFPEVMKDYKWYKNWKNANGLKLRIIILLQQYFPMYNKKKTDFAGEFKIRLLRDFEAIGVIAEKLNIKIYSTSKTSPLNNLPGYSYINL